jgi:hypothetical protein
VGSGSTSGGEFMIDSNTTQRYDDNWTRAAEDASLVTLESVKRWKRYRT